MMRRCRAVLGVVALLASACGGGGAGSAGGETRKVLVDYKHDQFSASFLAYFPTDVKVHAGDTVEFKQFWTGEPHTVTMGTLIDELGKPFWEIIDGMRSGTIKEFPEGDPEGGEAFFEQIPFMADEETLKPIQAAAQPCYLDTGGPDFSDVDKPCPKREQPAFNGRQSYYNSGFIPYEGEGGNSFKLPIAKDTAPGTYHYYCNWHFLGMSGTVTVVPETEKIPSQSEVARKGQQEARDYTDTMAKALSTVRAGKKLPLPLAGAGLPEELEKENPLFHASINEFVPATLNADVGQKVTWTFDGGHSIAFNVPKYFPVFDVKKDGTVTLDKRGFEPVKFPGPPDRPDGQEGGGSGPPTPIEVDAGQFDGSGGLHSSGMDFDTGDKFSLRFTKPGTYLFACLIHPPMVGKVVVK